MRAVAPLTPRSRDTRAPVGGRPGPARPSAAPESAQRAPLDHADDPLGATLARAVQLRAAHPPGPVLQRMYFPDDDEEYEGGSLVAAVWDWLTSLFRRPAPATQPDVADDDTSEDLDDVLDDVHETIEEIEQEQPLALVGASSHGYSEHELAAAMRAFVIRQDFEVNSRLLQALERRYAFQYAHTFSPDVEEGVEPVLGPLAKKERLRRIELERLAAIAREAQRVLEACQRIHTELRAQFKASLPMRRMQQLALELLGFVIKADLGEELTQLASSISTGVNRLGFKDFKVGEPTALKITEAPSLLDALKHLSIAVEGRLAAQEQTKKPQKHKPTKHELETKARFERRQNAKAGETDLAEDVVAEESEATPTPTVVAPVYVPVIFNPGWNEADMRVWVDNMVPKRTMEEKNIKNCVAFVKVHTPLTGGGTSLTHETKPVYHISHGKKGSGTGCTLFFTKDGDRVQIIGIGQHTTGVASYTLDWKAPTFSGNINEYTVSL